MVIVLLVVICLLVLALTIGAVCVFCEDNAKKKQLDIEKFYSQKIQNNKMASCAEISALHNQIRTEREAFIDYKTKYPMKAKYKVGTEVFVNIFGKIQKSKVVAVCFADGTVIYSVDCSGIVLNGLKEDQISRNEADLGN